MKIAKKYRFNTPGEYKFYVSLQTRSFDEYIKTYEENPMNLFYPEMKEWFLENDIKPKREFFAYTSVLIRLEKDEAVLFTLRWC